MIPKIIHQSWISDTHPDVPEVFREYMESIPENFKDWKYILWNNENSREVVYEVAPRLMDFYDSSEDIMKSDISRYCFLWKYGGLYLDLDIRIDESIEDLFKEDCSYFVISDYCDFFKDRGWGTVISNCMMACGKQDPLMRKLVDCLNKRYFNDPAMFKDQLPDDPNVDVLMSTGPGYLTRIHNIFKKQHKSITLDMDAAKAIHANLGTWTKNLSQ